MDIKEVKKQYQDEWVLAEILEEDGLGMPVKVEVIAHSKNRDETYKAMKAFKSKYTYHFYAGNVPQEGYAVAFYEIRI